VGGWIGLIWLRIGTGCGNVPSGSINVGNFLTSRGPVRFSGRNLLQGVIQYQCTRLLVTGHKICFVLFINTRAANCSIASFLHLILYNIYKLTMSKRLHCSPNSFGKGKGPLSRSRHRWSDNIESISQTQHVIVRHWNLLILNGVQWWDFLNVVMNYSCSYIKIC
jgi:hypothetical protein